MSDNPHHNKNDDTSRLGTLEFISAINGDDPLVALRALRKFVKTVRRERRLALKGGVGGGGTKSAGHSEDDSDEEEDDDDDDDDDDDLDQLLDSTGSKKRRKTSSSEGKRDQWKDDTAGYNVPFVGTSVIKGSTGTPIRRGVWPCGLLESYLSSSPKAIELLGGLQTTATTAGTAGTGTAASGDGDGNERGGRDGPSDRSGRSAYSRSFVVTTNTNQLVPPHGALHRPLLRSSGKTHGNGHGHGQNGQQLSTALHAAYLQAVEEVCTAVVPIAVLKRDLLVSDTGEGTAAAAEEDATNDENVGQTTTTMTSRYEAIATSLARDHLRPFLHLLNEQCSQAASFDPKYGGNKAGGGGGRHRVGPLTPTLLRLLTNIAATGTGAAREVVRGLDSELREGALMATLAAYSGGSGGNSRAGGKKRKAVDDDANDEKEDDEEPSPLTTKTRGRAKSKMDARTAALRMCAVLLDTSDPTVLSFVCSGGSRERKTNAGLVHTALRVGLAGGLFDTRRGSKRGGTGADGLSTAEALESNAGYLRCLGRFLASIRLGVLSSSDAVAVGDGGAPSRRRSVDGRVLLELLNGDVMDQLMRISKFAPPLEGVVSFQDVLAATDAAEAGGGDPEQLLKQASRECRQLLFLLLGDRNRSPFLLHINEEAAAAKEIGGRPSPQEHIVNRALMWLLNNEHSLPIRAFILHCLRTTPQLLFSFFRSLPMPEAKPSYECLSAIAFASNVITDGPSVSECIVGLNSSSIQPDQAMHFILPSSVSKAFLTKAVQSQSALLVAEVLRLISDVLRRADKGGTKVMLGDALHKRLPDLQILLSLRSRFDPFSPESENESSEDDDEGGAVLSKEEVVTLRLFEVLQLYRRILPSTSISSVKFDWAKLFPDDLSSFFSVSSTVQLAILQTYDAMAIQHGAGKIVANSPKALRTLLMIVLSSTSSAAYDLARKLAIRLILSTISEDFAEGDEEPRRCLEYEAALWVDGTSAKTVEEVLDLVTASSQHSAQHVLSVSRAWSAQFPSTVMPRLCFSGILSAAIARFVLDPSGLSAEFGKFVCGVATKALLYHRESQALASFIKYCDSVSGGGAEDDGDEDSSHRLLLLRYASALLDDESIKGLETLEDLTSTIFGEDNLHSKLCRIEAGYANYSFDPEAFPSILPVVIARQCLHRLALIRTHSNATSRARLLSVIQRTLAHASNVNRGDILREVFKHPYMLGGCGSTSEAASFVSSLPTPGHIGSTAEADATYLIAFGDVWMKTFASALADDQVFAALASLMSSLSTLIGPSFSARVVGLVLKDSQGLDDSELVRSLLLTTLTSVRTARSFDKTFPVSELVQVWIGLASSNKTTKDEHVEIPLQLALEEVICNILAHSESNGIVAAALASALASDIEEVFSSYVASAVLSKGHRSLGGSNLLAAMVKYDCVRFAPPLSELLSLEKQPLLKVQLGEQWFAAVSPLLLAYTKQTLQVPSLLIYESLSELAWQGVEAVLAGAPKTLEEGNIESVKDWLSAMQSLLAKGDVVRSEDAFESTIVFFRTLASRSKLRLFATIEEPMLNAAIGLCLSAPCDANTSTQLSSYIFLRLLILLPRALRKGRRQESQATTKKDHDPTFVLASLIRLLNEGGGLSEDIILGDESSLCTGFISCLKYGIKDNDGSGDDSDVAQMCIRLAQALVVKASTQYPALLQQIEMLHPAQVHRMVTSHSSFSVAMQQGNADTNAQVSPRQDLIHLLICCASLASGALEDIEDAWVAVLRSYSAGVTREDKALRRLMHLYCTHIDEKRPRFIDCLKWGDMPGVTDAPTGSPGSNLDGGDHAQQYEWFVQALDIRRVRSTLSSFPVWECLSPDADLSLETWTATNDGDSVDDDASSAYSEASGDESDDEKEDVDEDDEMTDTDNGLSPRPRRKDDQSDEWNGHGADDRYSPPFILTLALATLEAFNTPPAPPKQKHDQGHDRDNDNNDNISTEEDPRKPRRETFVKIARRLSEKGCISLGLAALSSKCPGVRQLAIATLGLFLKALHMEEAHSLKIWRERPQIAMVLDSVQRGIAVRRAITLDRRKEEGTEDQPLLVPMFPAVSAVFLGWSALIVSRPSDDMFASANRSFLRLDDYHGAFKDCFALPAFISLFCGSFAEENSQARRGKLWALQLLKDGVRDSYCYKVAARRHAPALIMTSFESLVSGGGLHEADAEPYLLLETIECLLLNGGHAARHHLISNLGLCSWLRGILIGKQHSFVFPSDKLLLLFFRLVDNTFKCATREENEESGSVGDVRSDAMDMAGPLVDAYEQMRRHTTSESAIREILYALLSTLDTLSICSGLGMEGKTPPSFDSLRVDGISITSALQLLEEVAGSRGEISAKATRSLSTLPISPSTEDQDIGKQFCLALLKHAQRESVGGDAVLLGKALTRVFHVLGTFSDKLHGDEELIETILSCKPKAQWCDEGALALAKAVEFLGA